MGLYPTGGSNPPLSAILSQFCLGRVVVLVLETRGKIEKEDESSSNLQCDARHAYTSRPWVRVIVSLLESFDRQVGIDLSGGQVRVAQQLLHAAQIGPGVQQMRRVAVS